MYFSKTKEEIVYFNAQKEESLFFMKPSKSCLILSDLGKPLVGFLIQN